jgi:hypothetical protein
MYTDGSSITPGRTGNVAYIYQGRLQTNSNDIGGGIFHIMDYASSAYGKTMIGQSFGYVPILWYAIGTWRSTSAITRLDLTVESGHPFATGFTATLYGIKAA